MLKIKEFFLVSTLKLLTFLQVKTLSLHNNRLYYYLTSLHFKLYFKKEIMESAEEGGVEFELAAVRHADMVVSVLFKELKNKEKLHKSAISAFKSNLILNISL